MWSDFKMEYRYISVWLEITIILWFIFSYLIFAAWLFFNLFLVRLGVRLIIISNLGYLRGYTLIIWMIFFLIENFLPITFFFFVMAAYIFHYSSSSSTFRIIKFSLFSLTISYDLFCLISVSRIRFTWILRLITRLNICLWSPFIV